VSVVAKVVSIEALEDTARTVLTLSLEELSAKEALWEVLSQCRNRAVREL
jgi:hypothetical protein